MRVGEEGLVGRPTFWKLRIPHQQGNVVSDCRSEMFLFVNDVLPCHGAQGQFKLAHSADSWPDKAGAR